MKNRIIISISELNKSNWALIYKFIKDFYNDSLMISTFNTLKNKKWLIDLKVTTAPRKDIYSAYGEDLTKHNRPKKDDTTFSIIYQKQNTARDFSDLVPFFFLYNEFKNKVSLGIDINTLPEKERNEYIFSSRQFFALIKDSFIAIEKENIDFVGNKLYLIHNWVDVDKKTGEIKKQGKTTKLGNKESIENKEISRYFTPLIEIDKDNINALFVEKIPSTDIPEIKYFNEAISKIDLSKYKQEEMSSTHFNSKFDEFFVKSYLNSLEIAQEELEPTIVLLKTYCYNIRELVENIILHTTDKKGLFYFIFNKKANITNNNNIPNFADYGDNNRFVEIGIYDYNKQGILETYNVNFKQNIEETDFKEFYNPQSNITTGIDDDHFALRYAAHLGLKSFTKSITEQMGYFSVETNNGTSEKLRYNSNNKPNENNENSEFFFDGTHYEIILPVRLDTTNIQSNEQHAKLIAGTNNTIREQLIDIAKLQNVNIDNYLEQLSVIPNSKQEQITLIENVGNAILLQYNNNTNEIAVNLSNKDNTNSKLLFKIISYLQLSKQKGYFRKIILTHISENLLKNICEDIDNFLVKQNKKIWSKDSALILLTDNLQCQIIWGETSEELYAINKNISLIYFNENVFEDKSKDIKLENYDFKDFVLPYDCLIVEQNKLDTVFENYVSEILDNEIEQDGYKSSIDYTRIGRKVIIKNFYEADTLFKNSFFVERLGYLIAKNIIESDIEKQNIVLIGYLPYSDLLINTIEYYINKKYENAVSATIITKEDENKKLIWLFDNESKEKIKANTNNYITIIPIGSTLTTSDKIIAFFKQHIHKEYKELIDDARFVLNYCAILVRDKLIQAGVTELEESQKWKANKDKTITTEHKNAKEVRYLVAKTGEWHLSIDKEFYPDRYKDEEPINLTQNASLNYQNLFYYPKVKKIIEQDFETELERIKSLEKFIYCGHLICYGNHHRYYIETEYFVRFYIKNQTSLLCKWIKEINQYFDKSVYNVLITPNTNIESDFINQINDIIFNRNALILWNCYEIN